MPALASFIGNVTFPVVGACNMDTSGEPALAIKKWHVAMVAGRKVALLGYIAQDTGSISSAGDVSFSDPVRPPSCLMAVSSFGSGLNKQTETV